MRKSNPRDDLRATEESIERDAREILELEEEKSRLDAADPRVDAISEHVEGVASAIATKSRAEREISEEIKPGE